MATTYFMKTLTITDFDDPNFAERTLDTTRGSGTSTNATTTTAGGTQIQLTTSAGANGFYWYTPMLQAFTLAGTVTFNVWAFESAATVNASIAARLDVTDAMGSLISTPISLSSFVTELGTTSAVKNWTATPTSTSILNGQRLRLILYAVNAGTMAAGTVSIVWSGATAAASGDSFITLTETVTTQTGGTHPQWSPQPNINTAVKRSYTW